MVALKHRHFGALLAICALVLSFFGVTQVVSASVPAHADAPACPAPVTNVSDKVTLDWDKAQLVDHTGHEVHAVGDWWDLGVKLPWQTEGRVKAGDRSAPERCACLYGVLPRQCRRRLRNLGH